MAISSDSRRGSVLARLTLSILSVGLALGVLSGCGSSSPAPRVTVTIPPPAAEQTPSDPGVSDSEPDNPPKQDPVTTTDHDSPDPDPVEGSSDLGLIVSRGEIASECVNTTCWYVHLEWETIEPGSHQVQCWTDATGVGLFSDNSLRFDATQGERDLKCFIGHPGSKVWVVIDGVNESNHATWE